MRHADQESKLSEFFGKLQSQELFPDGEQGLAQLPPLLDPSLSPAEARERHISFCTTVWYPACEHSGFVLDGEAVPEMPDNWRLALNQYRNLARDMPIQVEFIPTIAQMRQLVWRAAQIDKNKIKGTINPFESRKIE